MSFLENTSPLLKYTYKLTGALQFSMGPSPSRFSRICERLWCIPLYLCYVYFCIQQRYTSEENSDVFNLLDTVVGLQNMIYVSTSWFLSIKRANRTRSLLLKVDKIKLYALTSPNKGTSRDKWLRLLLLGSLLLTVAVSVALQFDYAFIALFMMPRLIGFTENLFIDDILVYVAQKFELINQHLQRQTNTVDLAVIFPLTKLNKIKLLEDDDIAFNIERIQELSHLHYDLVHLAIETGKNFEMLVIVSLALWFAYVIESVYAMIYMALHETTHELTLFGLYGSFIFYLFCWLFVLVASFSHTQQKANATSTYVHDIWNRYALAGKIDRKTRHLQLISIRLLNTKLQFTAMDFFNLDWTFCHMIIAAVTTYVVIVIQFHI